MTAIGRLAAGTMAAALLGGGAEAAILANGDFEAPSALYALPSGWNPSVAATGGPMNAPNLFVTDGAAYTACCGTTGSAAAEANRFATFGAGDSPNAGAVLGQSFATVMGQAYVVSFDLAAFGAAGTQALHVRVDDLSNATHVTHQDYVVASGPDLDAGFATHGFGFVATGALTLLSFQNVDVLTDDIDAVVDNVSVTAAVPEPAAWTLMILGFGGLGLALRRRAPAPTPA